MESNMYNKVTNYTNFSVVLANRIITILYMPLIIISVNFDFDTYAIDHFERQF